MGTRKPSSQVMRFPTGRRVPRRKPVLPGRTIHLIDIENLAGGVRAGVLAFYQALDCYRYRGPVAGGDRVVIGASPQVGCQVKPLIEGWPSVELYTRGGPNGADIALIERVNDVHSIVARFDRIIIGSGDGDFAPVAEVYIARGLAVDAASRPGSLSRKLEDVVHDVWYFPELDLDLAA